MFDEKDRLILTYQPVAFQWYFWQNDHIITLIFRFFYNIQLAITKSTSSGKAKKHKNLIFCPFSFIAQKIASNLATKLIKRRIVF